jgi:Lipopolysaccharide export system permease LptF/LptG
MTAPSGQLRRFLSRHCATAAMDHLVDPILTDIQIESTSAAVRGQRWASRWIRAAGAIALIKALAVYGWTRFWSIREWSADDRRALIRTLSYFAAVAVAAIPLLMMPFLLRFPATRAWEVAPYLVPQALPLALPVGLFVGLLYGFRARVVSPRPRTAVIILAVLCSAASFASLAWIVPVSNQAFRVAVSGNERIEKGTPEMTLGELRTRIGAYAARGRDVSRMALTYHARWALAAAPVVLTSWAFLVVARLPNRRLVVGIVAIASCVAYYSLMGAGQFAVLRESLPPAAGAWLPNAAFVAALILLPRRTPNDERRTAAASL